MTVLCFDSFTRTVSPGLGSEPTTGHAYQYSTANTDWSATGTVARTPSTVVGTLYYATLDCGSVDHVVRVTETLPVMPAGANITLRCVGRWLDSNNYVEAQVIVTTAGAASLSVTKRVAGAQTGLGSIALAGTHVAGNAWTIVLEVYGGTVRARAWNATTGGDGGLWQVTGAFADATLLSGMQAGFGVRRETGNTNGTTNVDFDSFTVATLITTTLQPEWPPRVLISVTSLATTDTIAVYRVVSGARTAVRAGSAAAVGDVSFVVLDAELPFGVPVSYVAVINGSETASASTTYTLTGGKVALSDAVGGQSAEVTIRAWPEKAYDRRTSRFRAGGRNIVVAGDLAGYSGTLELFTLTTSSRDNVAALLDGATEGVIQIRQPGGYDGVDGYVAVTGWVERRFSQDGTDQRRTLLLDVVEVEGWAPALEARGYTLQDVADAYTGLTLADLGADYATLLALAQASF